MEALAASTPIFASVNEINRLSCATSTPRARSTHGSWNKQFLGAKVTSKSLPAQRRRRFADVSAMMEPSGGLGGNMYEHFDENDQDFVRASILAATEVKSGSEGFIVKMWDGSLLRCAQNGAKDEKLPDYAAQPAMVLKMEDGSDILLPLIVMDHPRQTLMEAMRNIPVARPTTYQVIRNMIETMGHEVKMVRITHRVCEAYYARLYVGKVGDETGAVMSFDLRPSDAINIAIQVKCPIQVNKALAAGDGVRQVSMVPRGGSRVRAIKSYHFTWTEQDRPDVQDRTTTSEFALTQLMHQAAAEERFGDAARMRDELMLMRMRRLED